MTLDDVLRAPLPARVDDVVERFAGARFAVTRDRLAGPPSRGLLRRVV